MKNLAAVVALSLCVALLPSIVHADGLLTGEQKRETLRDLTGVQVIVEPLAEAAEQDGLTSVVLQQDIEQQLKRAGIRVLSHDERQSQPGFPFLYVGVTTVKAEAAAVYSYAIDISLNQTVNLTRHPTIAMFAPTWTSQSAGVVSPSRVGAIGEHVYEVIARFIQDYWAMNRPDGFQVLALPHQNDLLESRLDLRGARSPAQRFGLPTP